MTIEPLAPVGKTLSDVATSLAKSLLGGKPTKPAPEITPPSDDVEEVDEVEAEDEAVEEEAEEAMIREVEIEGETIEARQDESHGVPGLVSGTNAPIAS